MQQQGGPGRVDGTRCQRSRYRSIRRLRAAIRRTARGARDRDKGAPRGSGNATRLGPGGGEDGGKGSLGGAAATTWKPLRRSTKVGVEKPRLV